MNSHILRNQIHLIIKHIVIKIPTEMAKYKILKIFIFLLVKCESQLVGLRQDPTDVFNYSVPSLSRGKQCLIKSS